MTRFDPPLTLRELSILSGTPLRTLQKWTVEEQPALVHEHIGRQHRKVVRVSVVMRFYPRGCLNLERLRTVVSGVRFRELEAALARTQTSPT